MSGRTFQNSNADETDNNRQLIESISTANIKNHNYEMKNQVMKSRENQSTRGGLSLGGRSEFAYSGGSEIPFLVLSNQDQLDRFMTKQRKMISSVSSKYLTYNTHRSSTVQINETSPNRLVKQLNQNETEGQSHSKNKLSNFNQYQHVYNDSHSNEANVSWIIRLREPTEVYSKSDNKNSDTKTIQSVESHAPSCYFKGRPESIHKVIPDFEYGGNHSDIAHLSTKRIGPTANISQVVFETGLRKNQSVKNLKDSHTDSRFTHDGSGEKQKKDFVSHFGKAAKSLMSPYSPTFLPPINQQSIEQLQRLPIIREQAMTVVKGHKGKQEVQMISSFDGMHKSMPKFTDKIETDHDYNKIRHLMKSNKKMSQVLWELSLRPEFRTNKNKKRNSSKGLDTKPRTTDGLKQKNSWKMFFYKDDAEFKILENQNKICSAMYDEEKNDIKMLNQNVKQEIAKTAQLELTDIQDTIQKYKQMEQFHWWLKSKESKKEPIPETREELMHLYRVERPRFLMKRPHKQTYCRAQMKYSMRRHYT